MNILRRKQRCKREHEGKEQKYDDCPLDRTEQKSNARAHGSEQVFALASTHNPFSKARRNNPHNRYYELERDNRNGEICKSIHGRSNAIKTKCFEFGAYHFRDEL